jgi:hypothetical protein
LSRANGDTSYAFKALAFWKLVPLLQKRGISARINVVVSRFNIAEVPAIIRRAVEMGFAASFCFVQTRQKEFNEFALKGFTSASFNNFRQYLESSEISAQNEMRAIIKGVRQIIKEGELIEGPFNAFRGDDPSEAEIPPDELFRLRGQLLDLQKEFGSEKILLGEGFIKTLGERGFGCLKLLKQGRYPQMKIGSEGQMIFCCDLHDPITQAFRISDFQDLSKIQNFLEAIRNNPYIWLCAYFNPCDFSVNRVEYGASKL